MQNKKPSKGDWVNHCKKDLAEFESGTPWNCDDIECEFNDLPEESEEEECKLRHLFVTLCF